MIKTKEKSRHPKENDGVGLTWKTAYPWKSSVTLNCYPSADGYYTLYVGELWLNVILGSNLVCFFLFFSLIVMSI